MHRGMHCGPRNENTNGQCAFNNLEKKYAKAVLKYIHVYVITDLMKGELGNTLRTVYSIFCTLYVVWLHLFPGELV